MSEASEYAERIIAQFGRDGDFMHSTIRLLADAFDIGIELENIDDDMRAKRRRLRIDVLEFVRDNANEYFDDNHVSTIIDIAALKPRQRAVDYAYVPRNEFDAFESLLKAALADVGNVEFFDVLYINE